MQLRGLLLVSMLAVALAACGGGGGGSGSAGGPVGGGPQQPPNNPPPNNPPPSNPPPNNPPPPPSTAPVAVACEHTGIGKDYRVGPGQEFASIGAVKWEGLEPGDTVRIFYRDAPYAEKIFVVRSGTEAQPIRVCGVPSDGKLPVITGADATTRTDLAGIVDAFEDFGIVTVASPFFEDPVEHVIIEGLKVTGTLKGGDTDAFNKYRTSHGANPTWSERAGCIRLRRAHHIQIRGNDLANCGYGIFTASTPENDANVVRDVLVAGNYIHDNGLLQSDQRHQAYLQGIDFTVEFNYFGETRHLANPNAQDGGNDLKTRVAGLDVRYNYFDNAVNAHHIDIVEVEEHRPFVMPWRHKERVDILKANGELDDDDVIAANAQQALDYAKYQDTYVYGNLIHLHGSRAETNPIHVGFDNTAMDRSAGRYWIYNNTFLVEADSGKTINFVYYGANVGPGEGKYGPYQMNTVNSGGQLHYITTDDHDFMDGDGEDDGNICDAVSATCKDRGEMLPNERDFYPHIKAYNNALVVMPLTAGGPKAALRLTRFSWDQLDLEGGNWINVAPAFGTSAIDADFVWDGGNDQPHVTGDETLIQGMASPIVLGTFEPVSGSELLDKAVELPAELQGRQPVWQVVRDPAKAGKLAVTARTSLKTIGAIETPSAATSPGPGIGNVP